MRRPKARAELAISKSTDPETGVAPGVTRGRNMRSRYRCSMCPAIHISSRSWLRSSSTHEPSDPPLRVFFQFRPLADESVRGALRAPCHGFSVRRRKKKGFCGATHSRDGSLSLALGAQQAPRKKVSWASAQGRPEARRRREPRGHDRSHFDRETRPALAGDARPPGRPVAVPTSTTGIVVSLMILPQVHLRKPCYDFYFL